MIRSTLKSGLKKLADRVLGAPVPPPAPPAPAWKTAPAAAPSPGAQVPAATTPAPAVVAAPAAPTEAHAASPTGAPSAAESSGEPEVSAPVAVEAAPVVEAAATSPDSSADEAPARGKKSGKKAAAAKQTRAAETATRLQASAPAVEEAPAPAVVAPPPPAPVPSAPPADDVVGPALSMEALQEVIDEMVRPALQGDGGDITLLRIEGGKVFVKLVGACSTCPSSIATLKLGVEALLKEEFPAIEEIVQEM